MQITIKLFGGYRAGRFREAVREYPGDSSVGTVLQSLNIASAQGILLLNGKPALWAQPLSDGDTLTLFPLVSGG